MARKEPLALRALAQQRLQRLQELSPEEWAKAVEGARQRGYRLRRFTGLVVEIRDYSLEGP